MEGENGVVEKVEEKLMTVAAWTDVEMMGW